MEPNNETRAFWAQEALHFFQQVTGADDGDALADLLADLMHLADRSPVKFADALRRAALHYEAEVEEECGLLTFGAG